MEVINANELAWKEYNEVAQEWISRNWAYTSLSGAPNSEIKLWFMNDQVTVIDSYEGCLACPSSFLDAVNSVLNIEHVVRPQYFDAKQINKTLDKMSGLEITLMDRSDRSDIAGKIMPYPKGMCSYSNAVLEAFEEVYQPRKLTLIHSVGVQELGRNSGRYIIR